jgi:CRP-like cAMP-binding protein
MTTLHCYSVGEQELGHAELVHSLRIILSGNLEFSVLSNNGKQYVRWYLEPGKICDLIAVFDGKPIIYNIRAYSTSIVLSISRTIFLQTLALDSTLVMPCSFDFPALGSHCRWNKRALLCLQRFLFF